MFRPSQEEQAGDPNPWGVLAGSGPDLTSIDSVQINCRCPRSGSLRSMPRMHLASLKTHQAARIWLAIYHNGLTWRLFSPLLSFLLREATQGF